MSETSSGVSVAIMRPEHAPSVLAIYRAGMDEGNATFETEVPVWEEFDAKRLPEHSSSRSTRRGRPWLGRCDGSALHERMGSASWADVNASAASTGGGAMSCCSSAAAPCSDLTVLRAVTPRETAAMSEHSRQWLAGVTVDEAVFALRPDYQALVLTVDGLRGGQSDAASDAMLTAATRTAAELVATAGSLEALPHVAEWRETYRAFGAKPQRTRPSVDALLRRLDSGLPRIDRVTDSYNAISVSHVVPIGGEDLNAYTGSARLTRATGDETFETTAGGEPVVEHPDAGEVIWRDDVGVTCRRWNWRQTPRTRITTSTTRAVFIFDGLAGHDLDAAADALEAALRLSSPRLETHRRSIVK